MPKEFGFEVGDDLPGLSALTGSLPGAAAGAASGALGQAQGVAQGAVSQAQGAAAGAVSGVAAGASSALASAGVPPDVANAISGTASQAALSGIGKAAKAVADIPGHLLGGLFHHHGHAANIPAVVAARTGLSAAEQAGFDKATALITAAQTGAPPPANLTLQEKTAFMLAQGAQPKTSWLRLGAGAAVLGGVTFVFGAALPIVAIAAVVGAGAVHVFGKDKVT